MWFCPTVIRHLSSVFCNFSLSAIRYMLKSTATVFPGHSLPLNRFTVQPFNRSTPQYEIRATSDEIRIWAIRAGIQKAKSGILRFF